MEIRMKLGLFVDLKNLYYNVNKNWAGKRVNYELIQKQAISFHMNYEIYRAIAFGTEIKNEAGPFKNYLEAIGYEIQYRRSKYLDTNGLYQRASWDSGITLAIMSMAPRLDIVVLASNNEDFIPVLNWCVFQGLKVHIFACGITCPMMEACHSYKEITQGHLLESESIPNLGTDQDGDTETGDQG